jgi:hypothetical protein
MIPFDLGTINVLTYDESLATWTLDQEIKRLAEHVSNVSADGTSGNAMWRPVTQPPFWASVSACPNLFLQQ